MLWLLSARVSKLDLRFSKRKEKKDAGHRVSYSDLIVYCTRVYHCVELAGIGGRVAWVRCRQPEPPRLISATVHSRYQRIGSIFFSVAFKALSPHSGSPTHPRIQTHTHILTLTYLRLLHACSAAPGWKRAPLKRAGLNHVQD